MLETCFIFQQKIVPTTSIADTWTSKFQQWVYQHLKATIKFHYFKRILISILIPSLQTTNTFIGMKFPIQTAIMVISFTHHLRIFWAVIVELMVCMTFNRVCSRIYNSFRFWNLKPANLFQAFSFESRGLYGKRWKADSENRASGSIKNKKRR